MTCAACGYTECMCWLDAAATPELLDVSNSMIALIFTQTWPMERTATGQYRAPAWVIAVAETATWALGEYPFGTVKAFCAKVRDVALHAFLQNAVMRGLSKRELFDATLTRTNTRDTPG